jgi:hypothetical protein
MRASEILRKLADVIDSQETGDMSNSQQAIQAVAPQQVPAQAQRAELVSVAVSNNDTADSGTFVPPLQAKIELLKKAVDVDSIYDQSGPDEDLTGHGDDNEDELAQMKKRAGIHPVVASEAADDEPLDV